MRISILDLTGHPKTLLWDMPRVGALIRGWLAPALPEAVIEVHDVAEGGAALPETCDFDGLVVSGSEHGVYDPVPWIAPLKALLLATRDTGKPIYGICFGHQIMADTFGGRAEKAPQGNHIGARRFAMDGQGTLDAHVWHQDQVTAVPPGARVTGRADHCPVAALEYDFPAQSVQFHPEYSQGHLRGLFTRLEGELLDARQRDAAIESFTGSQVAHDLGAKEAAAFFRQHVGALAR
ncbi:MAG: type 1 glutamine amidotransferase [Pseudomonadota bacterium]